MIKGASARNTGMSDQTVRGLYRSALADLSRPSTSLTESSVLDAGHDPIFDNLATAPIRQLAMMMTILSDLPGNFPRHLSFALQSYIDKIQARGTQPIVGLLKDVIDVIVASIGSCEARQEWLDEGMQAAFGVFSRNHRLLLEHFPADALRKDMYSRTPVDEAKATGRTLSKPFEDIGAAANAARGEELTTDDFVRIVPSLSEFGNVVGTIRESSEKREAPAAARNTKSARKSEWS